MAKLSWEARMSIEVLADKGVSNREVARLLGVSEGTVRYHRRRQATGAVDGRRRQVRKAAACREAIECWLAARGEGQPRGSLRIDRISCDSISSIGQCPSLGNASRSRRRMTRALCASTQLTKWVFHHSCAISANVGLPEVS